MVSKKNKKELSKNRPSYVCIPFCGIINLVNLCFFCVRIKQVVTDYYAFQPNFNTKCLHMWLFSVHIFDTHFLKMFRISFVWILEAVDTRLNQNEFFLVWTLSKLYTFFFGSLGYKVSKMSPNFNYI